MSEDEAADIVSSVHDSIFGFIADSCWENCNNKCVKEHEKNAYCNFCSFSEAGLPCPKKGEVSYKEIYATEKDMLH
jgi:hypothetical protein